MFNFEVCAYLFEIKKGENLNHRNTFEYTPHNIYATRTINNTKFTEKYKGKIMSNSNKLEIFSDYI